MTDTLRLAPSLALPLGAVTVTEAIVGIRGSGKTNTAVVEAEELLEHGQQIVAIDPTDSWWGLKSSKDGTKPGYPVVILGGRHQDLPLAAGDGGTIADFVVDSRASVILSLRHFESKGDVQRFITDFARRLYFRKGQQDDPTPIKVFIDEASIVVPQRVMGEEARMVGAIQQLVRQGRSSGIGVALIDQRPATINKDVLTQLELLVCHRITSPQDRKALVAWVEQHDTEGKGEEFLDTLAALDQGDAWFWSPGWLDLFKKVHVRERRTFDSSRTPKPGERVMAPTKVADVDLDALKAKLAATIEKARADDPVALKKEIARLQGELRKAAAGKPIVDTVAIDRAVHAAIAKRAGAAGKALDRVTTGLTRTQEFLGLAINGLGEVRAAWQNGDGAHVPSTVATIAPHRPGAATSTAAFNRSGEHSAQTRAGGSGRISEGSSDLPKGERLVLTAVAQNDGADRQQISILSGYKRSTRDAYIQRLSEKGFVETRGDTIYVSQEGIEALGEDFEPLPTGADLRDYWLGRLPEGERKCLAVLLDCYPSSMTREALGAMVGYKRSTRDAYLQRLGTRKLVESVGAGEVQAAPMLFED